MKSTEVNFPVTDYALAETLNSGQAFRWQPYREGWAAVVGQHWVHLIQEKQGIIARTAEPVQNWDWLKHYLQVHVNIDQVTGSFPDDEPMRESIQACFGLRLLRQEPWECLASFILSS